jgi:pimeloyl-ACP methyl ester carboxylesterase
VEREQNWEQRIGKQRDWVWRGWQTRYSYQRVGALPSRPPLILLHGFGAAIEHWRNNIPVLSQQYPVYALDLLGFGASRKATTDYTVSLWVEQVHDFWQTFIRQPVILVGNSISSLVCLAAAATYPEMVEGIVMLNLPDVSLRQEMIPQGLQPIVNGIEGIFAAPPLLKGLFQLLRHPFFIRRWAKLAYSDAAAITDELVEILAAPPQDEGSARTFSALFTAMRSPNFCLPAKVLLPQLKIPILLIWGCQDRMVPSSLAPMFASLNPQIKLIELDGAGHCPHDELPDQFNYILLDWLETNRRF